MRQVVAKEIVFPSARLAFTVTSASGLMSAGTSDVEDFGAVESQRLAALAFLEFQRQHSHPHQVRAMDAFVRNGNDGPDPQEKRPLRGPVA